ncbi:MAG: hypothetical protein RLO80_13085 [Hyphomonas sp.]
MLRILSILFLIAGLVVAGIGGAAMLEQYAPQESAAYESAAVEAAAAEEEMLEMAVAEAERDMAPPEVVAEPPAAKSAPETRSAAPESADPDVAIASEPALSEEEMGFNFQTQMEEAPMAAAEAGDVSPEVFMAAPPKPSFEDTLKTVPVAHETPPTAEYKRAFNVTFAIDATGDTTAADALPGRGVVEEGEAKVSERVEVRLSGAGFDIAQTSPPTQLLSPLTENTWRWSVTPLNAGDHDLTFEIFAIDSDSVTPLRTYRDTVTVKVSGLNRAIAFADQANPLFVLLGGLGSAIAGLFGAIRFFGKR